MNLRDLYLLIYNLLMVYVDVSVQYALQKNRNNSMWKLGKENIIKNTLCIYTYLFYEYNAVNGSELVCAMQLIISHLVGS